jgi:RNA polymerase sigma-70 factor (ECF subfamily)
MEDNLILDLYFARSESAISETAAKYGKYCHTIAMNILRNNEDSEECVSDTYLRAWDAIPPQRPSIFSSFLGKITRNLSLDRLKGQRAEKRGGGEIPLLLDELEECLPSASNVEAEAEANAVVQAINAFLDSLAAADRVVFIRRYWYADSIAAIAVRYQMSESKAKSMLFRTRNKLRAYLEKEGVTI